MATPDVRVRLSAEGVAEVVGALKKVQAEGLKAGAAGAQSAKGFFALNGALGATRTLLAQLGAAVSVGLLVGFVKNAAEAGDELGRVAQGAGASVENFSALGLAARVTDVPVQALQQGLAAVNQRLKQFRDGDAGTRKVFRDLDLSLKDLSGKDSVEQLEAVARALAGIEDPGKRAGLAIEFFGKRIGPRLAPLLAQLSEQGLGRLIQQAERLGVLFDTETIAAADNLTDQFALLQLQVQGLTLQFVKGLEPAVTGTLEIISGQLAGNAEAWEEWGRRVGLVLARAVLIVQNGADAVGTFLAQMTNTVASLGRVAESVASRGGVDLSAISIETTKKNEALEKSFNERSKKRLHEVQTLERQVREKQGRRGFGEDDLDPQGRELPRARTATPTADLDEAETASAKERFAKRRAQIDAELSLVRAKLKVRESEERRSLEAGTQSIVETFAARRRILEESLVADVAALEKRKALETQDDDPAKAAAAVVSIENEIKVRRVEHAEAIHALEFEETEATKRIEQVKLDAQNAVSRSRGQDHAVAIAEIREQGKALELELRRAGQSVPEARAGRDSFEAQLTSVADFEDALRQADRAMQQLDLDRDAIAVQVEAHHITELEGERHLLDLEKERLVQLRTMAEVALAAAEVTGNPDAILQALQLAAALDRVQAGIDAAEVSFRSLGVTAKDALQSGVVDELTDGVDAGNSLIQVVNNLGLAIARAVRQMIALAIAKKLVSLIPGFGGGGKVEEEPADFARGGQVQHRLATGGVIRGPGTGTSDSILASLPAGGYVVRARSVARPGVLGFLRGIASKASPFARGGRVLARVSNGEYFVHPSIVAQRGVLPALHSVNRDGLPAHAAGGRVGLPAPRGLHESIQDFKARLATEVLGGGGLPTFAAGGHLDPAAIRQFGIDVATMPSIADLAPRYAEGGLAGAMPSIVGAAGAAGAPGASGSTEVSGRIGVELSPGLIAAYMRSPEGQRVVLEVIGSNRRTIGRTIRG